MDRKIKVVLSITLIALLTLVALVGFTSKGAAKAPAKAKVSKAKVVTPVAKKAHASKPHCPCRCK